MNTTVFSSEELEHFRTWGYIRVTEALERAEVERFNKFVWKHLREKANILQENPTTWHQFTGCNGPNRESIDKVLGAEITPRLAEAVNQLLGKGQWRPLKTLGGLLMTMPDHTKPWERVLDWHFDNDPNNYVDNVNELMLFTFYTSVKAQGGGTLILAGSPRIVDHYLTAQVQASKLADWSRGLAGWHEGLSNWHPWLAELIGSHKSNAHTTRELMQETPDIHGVPARIMELTGEPGEAILCHPTMFHAVSANVTNVPRIMRRTNFRRKR